MAKTKQEVEETPQEENFLFAIGTPEGEHIVRIGLNGNLEYIKAGTSMDEASRVFWDSFQTVLPIRVSEVESMPNDAELGAHIRNRMASKLQNK